jgi:glycosyltransferase involved in cell wall biosynthesis
VQRVLFVTNMYPTLAQPAFGIIVERLAHALQASGIRVEVVSVSCGRGPADYLLARRRVAHAVRSFVPDVVHIHFGYTALATSDAYPRVVSFYGDDLNGESTGNGSRITLKSRLGVAISRWAAQRCERSIAVSEALRCRLLNADARSRCILIRDSVDTRLFSPGARAEARARLDIAENAELVLFPHSLHQRTKRLDLAQAAVERLRQHRPRAELWVVNGRHPNEMPDVYRAANALIVTSDLEGGPSCVKEALACGLPVVSVPVGDTRVLEEAGPSCFLTPRDPEALAAALSRALDMPVAFRSALPAVLTLDHSVAEMRTVYEAARRAHVARRPGAA